jgi:DNA-binding NarL/FixJ family response regulator
VVGWIWRQPQAHTDPLHRSGSTRERALGWSQPAGRTQIATELFITEKTAGVHVSNILAKLDVHGRTEAAAVAHSLGLADHLSRIADVDG